MALRYGLSPDHFDEWRIDDVSREIDLINGVDAEEYDRPLSVAGLRLVWSEMFDAITAAMGTA